MNARFAATNSSPAPVSASAVNRPTPPYLSATGASSAPCGAMWLAARRLDRERREQRHREEHAADHQRGDDADDLLPRLAHRRRELAQRFEPRIRKPGAREAAGGPRPAQLLEVPEVAPEVGPVRRLQLHHDRGDQRPLDHQRRQPEQPAPAAPSSRMPIQCKKPISRIATSDRTGISCGQGCSAAM